MTWHVDNDLAARYVDGGLTPARASSVESHLMACVACRQLLAAAVDSVDLARNWAAIADEIDQPRRGVVERVLVRVGLSDHLARLVVSTPSLRLPWLTAVGALLVVSTALTSAAPPAGDRGVFFFLVLAPLLPLVGVAAAFSTRTDPAHDLTAAAPISTIELLLVRSLGVLVTTTALTCLAAVAIPNHGWSALTWLLPALGLTTTALALTRWCPALVAAIVVGLSWVVASSTALVGTTARSQVVDHFVAFRPLGQAGFVALTCLAATVVVHQRAAFDLRRIA